MSTHSDTGLYAEDLYCSNPSNLIPAEVQTLQTPGQDDYYFIIPHAAPYYVETLELRNHVSGALYAEGVDYVIGHYFVDAMKSLKRPIAGSIRFLRKNITGQVRIKYHTVGGQWGFNANAILAELSNKQLNPITRSWEQIDGLPARFPSIAHDQPVDHLVGSTDIEEAIQGIATAVIAAAAGSSQSHIDARNNPHGVTKAQVGLPDVLNLPLASLTEALNTNFASGYSTPRTVYHAINNFALIPLNAHTSRTDNPHGVSKAQVGLALTPNMALANASQAINPLDNTVLMSPYTTALLIQATMPTGRLDDLELALSTFIARRDNPHEVTAAQTGTLTTAEIQALILASGSGDAIRFEGYTFTQFMNLVVEETEMDSMLTQVAGKVGDGTGLINGIDPTFVADIEQKNLLRDGLRPSEIYAGDGGYAIIDSEGESRLKVLPTLTHPPLASGGIGGQVIHSDNVLTIGADGSITKHNAAGTLVPHADYATGGGFVPANKASKIVATKTAIYIQCEDGRLVRTTGVANNTQLSATCQEVWCNVENAQAGEMVVYYDETNTLYAYGLPAFVTAFNALIAAWTTASLSDQVIDIVISDTHLIAMFGDPMSAVPFVVKLYTIDRSGGVAFNEVAAPVGNAVVIHGSFEHSGILLDTGAIVWYGTPKANEEELDITVRDFACGKGFTVFMDTRFNVEFWGNAAGNALDWNREVMYEHV